MKKYFFSRATYVAIITLVFLGSCSKKKEDPQPEVVTPTPVTPPKPIPVYHGNKLNMTNDSIRVAMIKALVDYAQSAKQNSVMAQTLLNMYTGSGTPRFPYAYLNNSSVKISSAIKPSYDSTLKNYFARWSSASSYTPRGTASNGTPGNIIDAQNLYNRYFDAKGFAVDELIEKSLAGAVQLYQIETNLAADKITSTDVSANLKSWDYAFAQLCIPLDYGNKDYGYEFPLWGKYLKLNDKKLGGTISKILNAFVDGQAAINAKDLQKTKDNAAVIKYELERVAASLVLTSLYNYKFFNTNNAQQEKLKSISQALGFVHILNSIDPTTRKISQDHLNLLIAKLSNNSWTFTVADADDVISKINGSYPGLNSTVDTSL